MAFYLDLSSCRGLVRLAAPRTPREPPRHESARHRARHDRRLSPRHAPRGALAYLIAALAATAVGPLLYGILHDRPTLRRHVDGFVYVVVPILVAWQILPVAWERRSIVPLLALGAGMLVPM